MIVPCECGAKLKIDEAKIGPLGAKVRCPRCGNILPVRRHDHHGEVEKKGPPDIRMSASDARAASVLVAHDSEVVRNSITSVLVDAGFEVDSAVDGKEALRKVTESKPRAMVLDVGLPGIYGFELCERLKGSDETNDIKIVLLSSVYDKKRYKRTPVSLYGADDYIEKHHIPDLLPLKLRKLVFPEQFAHDPRSPGDGRSELPEMARPPEREFKPSQLPERPVEDEETTSQPSLASVLQKPQPNAQEGSAVLPDSFSLDASIFQKEECDIPRVEAGDPEAVEKARRFARIIVSDIALYNQDAVAEGLRNGTFFDLLKTDIDEGRDIYEKRVPKAVREQKDYYQEAFDNFISAQGKNVR